MGGGGGGGGLVSREGGRYVVFALGWQAGTVSIRKRLCLPRRRLLRR